MTPLHFSMKLSSDISSSALQIVESAGHMVMVEQPARVSGILSVFFRRWWNNLLVFPAS